MADLFENTVVRIGLLPKIRSGNGMIQVIFPEWSYDLSAFWFWPYNWVIAALASRTPIGYTARDWATDPELAPGKIAPKTDLAALRAGVRARGNEKREDSDIWALFDSLPAPKANEMWGNWRGKVIFTGSWLDISGALLEIPASWLKLEWGKRFFSAYRGDPLIWIAGNKVIFPVPAWGNVSMPEIGLRGKVGATMTYDHQPWKDHFRILDDGKESGRRMLLGNWMSREKNGGWFTLEELPETNAAIADLISRSPY